MQVSPGGVHGGAGSCRRLTGGRRGLQEARAKPRQALRKRKLGESPVTALGAQRETTYSGAGVVPGLGVN